MILPRRNWKLKFELPQKDSTLKVDLRGDRKAIVSGLRFAFLSFGRQIEKRIHTWDTPAGLDEEVMTLEAILNGSQIKEYDGSFLTIIPAGEPSAGQTSSIKIEWADED